MHACGYKTVSTLIRSGAIVLSKLDILQGRHALDIIAVGLVTGLLDRLLSQGEYEKVIRCDTCNLQYKRYIKRYIIHNLKVGPFLYGMQNN